MDNHANDYNLQPKNAKPPACRGTKLQAIAHRATFLISLTSFVFKDGPTQALAFGHTMPEPLPPTAGARGTHA